MSEKRARYVGHPDGCELSIQYRDGDVLRVHVAYGDELPTDVEGRKVPAEYVKGLLEQEDNWTSESSSKAPAKTGEGDK